jgi:hypothetical protein
MVLRLKSEAKPMNVSRPGVFLIIALALGASTSSEAAMPLAPIGIDPIVVQVACAPGWYRGPGGACYIIGTGPGYYGGGGYYGRPVYRGGYYGRPAYRGGYYGHPAYRGGNRYHGGHYRRR